MSTILYELNIFILFQVSNLKKIVEKIHDFYQEFDTQHMGNFVKPDVTKIGNFKMFYCSKRIHN